LSGQDIIDTVLDGKRISQRRGTGCFGGFNGDLGLGQTTLAFSTGTIGLDTMLRELRFVNFVDELGFG